MFSRFLNCRNGTKSCKASQMLLFYNKNCWSCECFIFLMELKSLLVFSELLVFFRGSLRILRYHLFSFEKFGIYQPSLFFETLKSTLLHSRNFKNFQKTNSVNLSQISLINMILLVHHYNIRCRWKMKMSMKYDDVKKILTIKSRN